MGAALTRGVQRYAMACVKHFACNSIENSRFHVDVSVDDDVLEEVYLPHFRRVIEEGVASVMSAYNSVNGQWCGDSPHLLTTILREQWGFDGFVISDFVYGLRDPVGSVGAGLDLEMPFRQQRDQSLRDAVSSNALAIQDVNTAVERIVRTVLRFDVATPDDPPSPALLACADHRKLAREAAAEAIVLLRNETVGGAPVLPLCVDSIRRMAVLGPLATTANLGDRGSSNVHPPSVVTPMDGLRAAFPDTEWVEDASAADVAIVVVGYTYEDEGEYTFAFSSELFALMPPLPNDDTLSRLAQAQGTDMAMATGGDRRSLRLSRKDEELILRTLAVQPRTVVLMMGGSAIVVDPWITQAPAVLQVWYPGMEGGSAIADVLTGAANPSGRLPFAVPTDEAHLVPFDPDSSTVRYAAWHGQRHLDRQGHAARFPFGHGLSYTSFALVSAERTSDAVKVHVANTGQRSGAVVVFAFRIEESGEHLAGFRKVAIPEGETREIDLQVGSSERVRIALCAGDPDAIELSLGDGKSSA